MIKIIFKIFVVAAIIILAIFAKSFYKKAEIASLDVADDKIYVETINVKETAMPLTYKTVASLTAKYNINLSAAVDGQLSEIVAPSGSKVEKGDILLNLLPKASIRAPISGTITKWQVKPGEYINRGSNLGGIVDKRELQADYYVPEKYAKYLKLGQKVIIEIRGFDKVEFSAKVNFVSPFADPKRHSILVQVTIPNEDEKLLPGLFSKVTHILKHNPKALIISESCLIQTLTGYEVFVVKADNKVEKRTVTVGERLGGRVEILSGLKVNEKVVLTIPPGLMTDSLVVPEPFKGKW